MDKTKSQQAPPGVIVKGIPASSGIAIGKAYLLDEQYFCLLRQLIAPEEIENEISRFHMAVDTAQQEINSIREGALEDVPGDLPILLLDTHAQILKDPTLIREIEENIRKEKHNAEWALKTVLEEYNAKFSRIRDGYFRDRLSDIKSAVERLQRNLIQSEEESASLVEPVILVAHDLTPADTLKLDTRKVLAIATDAGGKTSHAGILAASMDIPAVVGLKTLASETRTGDTLIVDGATGVVVSKPSREQFLEYNSKRQKYLYVEKELHEQKDLEAKTLDGETIRIMANIESAN
ncbi:MAG: PEP-utilizing enzyme, partial [Nitrospinota bacterium]|nr:PEP-utilizing enzyme [Nitrospinota bacterium]